MSIKVKKEVASTVTIQIDKQKIENDFLLMCAKPMIHYLCEKCTPHTISIVTQTGVEILEGSKSIQGIKDFLKD